MLSHCYLKNFFFNALFVRQFGAYSLSNMTMTAETDQRQLLYSLTESEDLSRDFFLVSSIGINDQGYMSIEALNFLSETYQQDFGYYAVPPKPAYSPYRNN